MNKHNVFLACSFNECLNERGLCLQNYLLAFSDNVALLKMTQSKNFSWTLNINVNYQALLLIWLYQLAKSICCQAVRLNDQVSWPLNVQMCWQWWRSSGVIIIFIPQLSNDSPSLRLMNFRSSLLSWKLKKVKTIINNNR